MIFKEHLSDAVRCLYVLQRSQFEVSFDILRPGVGFAGGLQANHVVTAVVSVETRILIKDTAIRQLDVLG